jgi:eukaryotic-like serine/threonine-protein kinase
VRPFPATTGARWQVSNGGGSQPRWSSDGRELFYLDGNSGIVAAEVRVAPAFEITELRPLFNAGGFYLDAFHQSYDVLSGGRGFTFLRPHQAGRSTAGTTVVQAEHWLDDVRARAAH